MAREHSEESVERRSGDRADREHERRRKDSRHDEEERERKKHKKESKKKRDKSDKKKHDKKHKKKKREDEEMYPSNKEISTIAADIPAIGDTDSQSQSTIGKVLINGNLS